MYSKDGKFEGVISKADLLIKKNLLVKNFENIRKERVNKLIE